MADVKVIHCQSTRELPRWLYPVTYTISLDKLLEKIRQEYPGHQPQVYELGGLLYVKHPEAA